MQDVTIGDITIGEGRPLAVIAGPCVIETEKLALEVAEHLKRLSEDLRFPLIYKSSFEKDNRSFETHYRGPGLEKGLAVLAKVKKETGLPVTSDVHRESDIDAAADVLDVIQIPAYLCQQTSLLLKAGESGQVVNVKKGQFLAPHNIESAVSKIKSTGNTRILVTERGSSFGYNRLVSDMCSIPIMKEAGGFPVVFDATHIVRLYGIPSKDPKGGLPQYVPTLVRAGVAAGANALFLETHPDPPAALCDAASQVRLSLLREVLETAFEIAAALRKRNLA
ncbi:MAG: 3-deoxy-8-phosphooctulonate synthase [Deltaproteobacteria bacterium]|nr:3-deoxy-8-phosphooctulonate synthase [Deltaproteobacteria bacterium]